MCLELYIQILKKPREKIKCFETGHPGFHPEFHPEFDFRGTTHIPPSHRGLSSIPLEIPGKKEHAPGKKTALAPTKRHEKKCFSTVVTVNPVAQWGPGRALSKRAREWIARSAADIARAKYGAAGARLVARGGN